MEPAIRPLTALSAELPAALALVERVFRAFEAPEYPPEGVREFLDYIRPASITPLLQNHTLELWGAFTGDTLAGVLALRLPGHISLLFVDAPFHRRGIARRLFRQAQQAAVQAGAQTMTVHSSPYARFVYRRLGFQETAPERVQNGIRFFPMEYLLPPLPSGGLRIP